MLSIPILNNKAAIENPYRQYMYAYPHKRAYRDLGRVDIREHLHHLKSGTNHLYIHLPFCQSKCGFCNLFSVANTNVSYIDEYLNAIERQLLQYSKLEEIQKAVFSSLVIGGGTPLLLNEQQLERMFSLVEKYLSVRINKIYTVIETSPTQSDDSKLKLIHDRGVNRISLGVQSFIAEELKTLGRSHTVREAHEALHRIKAVGFDELNVDLIYGIPGQTVSDVRYSVNEALSYKPHEIFAYPLYLKEGTKMYKLAQEYEDIRLALYDVLMETLLANSYQQTSMRRFVLNGLQQNTSCGFDNVLALGCGGRSYLGNLHFCEPFAVDPAQCKKAIDTYINQSDFYHVNHGYLLNTNEQKRRYAIKYLLFYTGINEDEYLSYFNSDLIVDFPFIEGLEKLGYVERLNNATRLTPQGLALSDYIGPMFISNEVQQRMDSYQLL